MFARYAVYFTPDPGSDLAVFGAAWLGWDSAAGQSRVQPLIDGLDLHALTAGPRRYGFHATIKPPFRLAEPHRQSDLDTALAELCADAPPVTLDALELARMGRFLALVPATASRPLNDLAARVVRDLDQFRAPSSPAETDRRRRPGLSAAQSENLDRWGYPFVMDQFRFHMTLTGPADRDTLDAARAALRPLLAPLPLAPVTLGSLTLMGEDGDGRFHDLARHRLTGRP